MYQIDFVTSNYGKVISMRKWLKPLGIKVYKYRKKIEIPERKLASVEEISKYKVLDIYEKVNSPFVVQDSGFYIDAIPGYPGPDVNRVLSTLGVSGLLDLLAHNETNRGCYFKDALAFWSPNLKDKSEPIVFVSKVYGNLERIPSENKREEAWSSLWTIFIPRGFSSTLATMDKQEQKRFAEEVRSNPESNCFIAFADFLKANIHYLYIQGALDL